jgi:plasmid stabilization system protein ParE
MRERGNGKPRDIDVRRLRMRPSAARDLQEILDYIADAAGETVARRFTAMLEAQCHKLATLPGTLGRPRPELRPDIRSFPFRGYVIFFRYVEDVFEVVNILEGHRDMDAFFADEVEE